MEYQNNSALLEIEADSNVGGQINEVVDLVISDPTLIELMGKDTSSLTDVEADRLRLLGIRMLMGMEANFNDATERGLGNLENMVQVQRAIYHRDRLNYGLPFAWEIYKARLDSPYVDWFESNVIALPPAS